MKNKMTRAWLAVVTTIGLVLGASLATGVASPATAVAGSSVRNVGVLPIQIAQMYSNNTGWLAGGAWAGTMISYVVIPAGQCYAIQRKAGYSYGTYCNNNASYAPLWIQHVNPWQWNVKRTR